jgi:hypothetical protein
LIAALIVTGLFFYDRYRSEEKKRQEDESKLLFKADFDQLLKIDLERGDNRISLNKPGSQGKDRWMIVEPVHTAAEKFAVESLKRDLSSLSFSRLISETPENFSQYGLEKPSLIIKISSQKQTETISFGDKNPSGDGYYASTGRDNKVYLVDKNTKDKIAVNLFQLRDKKLFSIPFEHIDEFSIERDSEKWVLVKNEGKWQYKDDSTFEVDSSRVDSLVRMFTISQASSFEKEIAEDLKPFGLDKPAAVIGLSGEKAHEAMLLGKSSEKDETKIFAKMKGKSSIVSVDKWLLSDLPEHKVLLKKTEEDQNQEKDMKSGDPEK